MIYSKVLSRSGMEGFFPHIILSFLGYSVRRTRRHTILSSDAGMSGQPCGEEDPDEQGRPRESPPRPAVRSLRRSREMVEEALT